MKFEDWQRYMIDGGYWAEQDRLRMAAKRPMQYAGEVAVYDDPDPIAPLSQGDSSSAMVLTGVFCTDEPDGLAKILSGTISREVLEDAAISMSGGLNFWHGEDELEKVDHPDHYNKGEYEVIDVIEDWELNFNLGNVIKYVARADHKGVPIEDLEKAAKYLNFEIERQRRLMKNE